MVLVVFNNGTLMKRMRVLCSRPQMSVCLNNDLPEEWRQILAAAVQTTWQLYSNIEQAVCFWFLKLERLITLRPRYNKLNSKVNSDVVRCYQINVNFNDETTLSELIGCTIKVTQLLPYRTFFITYTFILFRHKLSKSVLKLINNKYTCFPNNLSNKI